jgi:uncharacterized membrane protein HdeD (DUF308 family)
MDIVGAFTGGAHARGWSLLLGGLSLAAGIYVLLNPQISLLAFVWIGGLWMIVSGIVVVVAAFMLRSKRSSDKQAPGA